MIPEGWKLNKLGDLVTFQRGHDLPRERLVKGIYPVAGSNGIIGYHNLYTTSGPGITIGRSGNIGTPYFYSSNFWAHNTTLYVKEFKGCDPKFMYYLLKTVEFAGHNSGSAVPSLNRNYIHPIEILAPIKESEQARIASILSSLDDKIELNLQMNKNLEAIAQAIFKEWFVDFRFPGFDGELVDGLPKGWKLKSLRDILALLKDGSHNPPKRVVEGIRFIAGATDIKDLFINFAKCTFITQDDYNKIHKNWEVQVNDILLTIVGTIGNTAIVRESDLPFSLQRSVAILRPKPEISHLYIYLIIKSIEFKNYLKSRTNPTGQPGVYLGTLSEYLTLVPSVEVMQKFHAIQSPLFEMMQRNIFENQILNELRDSLLPKLMTGKIKVA